MYIPSQTDRSIFIDLSQRKSLTQVSETYGVTEQKAIETWFNVSRYDRGLPPLDTDREELSKRIVRREQEVSQSEICTWLSSEDSMFELDEEVEKERK